MATKTPFPDFQNDPELVALAVVLRESRPQPEAEFTERLDAAVDDHFPREWSRDAAGRSPLGRFGRLRAWLGGRRSFLLPLNAGLAGLAVVVIAVGIGLSGNDGSTPTDVTTAMTSDKANPASTSSEAVIPNQEGSTADAAPDSGMASKQLIWGDKPRIRKMSGKGIGTLQQLSSSSRSGNSSAGEAFFDSQPSSRAYRTAGKYAAGVNNRKVAHEAEITLGAKPDEVQDVSNKIIEVVDDHNGIVLDSSVKDGPGGEAGASFSLMIPSRQLESAVSDLSGVADLRGRTQESTDITAPVLTVEDNLSTSRARVRSLVKELAAVTTETDRERVERELSRERRQAARLTTRLNRLNRKLNLTPVGVTVETGGDAGQDSGDSSWGFGDAIDDAGHMLAVSAGVALVALATAIPIGLAVLIALALNRAWIRRARRRALEEN